MIDKELLIKAFVKQFLPDAPDHIKESLEKKLSELDNATIQILGLNFPKIMKVCKMVEVSNAIKEAQESGVYEQTEDLASQIDLDMDKGGQANKVEVFVTYRKGKFDNVFYYLKEQDFEIKGHNMDNPVIIGTVDESKISKIKNYCEVIAVFDDVQFQPMDNKGEE